METNYFNLQGHLDDNWIGFYAEKTKEGKESEIPEEINAHVEKCHSCKSNVLELVNMLIFFEKEKEIEKVFSNKEAVAIQKKITKKTVFYYITRLAATIAILISVGLFSYYLLNVTINKPDFVGEEYTENMQLENELNNYTRNEERLNVSIISPKKDEIFDVNDEIKIKWECDENETKFEIVIFDNKNNELVFDTQITGFEYKIPMPLKKGLYYYRLYANSLQLTGKFYVE